MEEDRLKGDVVKSLRTLHDLSKAINSTLDSDSVVRMVMEKTAWLMGSEKVLVLFFDREKRTLRVHSSFGFAAGGPAVSTFEDVRPFDHCIVKRGTVITMKELLPEDGYSTAVAAVPSLGRMVFAPLEVKGEPYGLLGVLDEGRRFSQADLEIFCSLGSQSAVAIENANLYRRLKEAFLNTAEALAEAINSRDPYTGGHTRRVVGYSLMMAGELGFTREEAETLRLAAILHDIGKIGIDDAILRKGGALSPDEVLTMKGHPEIGAKILAHVDEMKDVLPGVRHHHERYDGRGYPDGLAGESIPLNARIIAIADAFDALTTDRPYKKATEAEAAMEELKKGSGSHFDPRLMDLFAAARGKKREER